MEQLQQQKDSVELEGNFMNSDMQDYGRVESIYSSQAQVCDVTWNFHDVTWIVVTRRGVVVT